MTTPIFIALTPKNFYYNVCFRDITKRYYQGKSITKETLRRFLIEGLLPDVTGGLTFQRYASGTPCVVFRPQRPQASQRSDCSTSGFH
jgi:hypothetical protein